MFDVVYRIWPYLMYLTVNDDRIESILFLRLLARARGWTRAKERAMSSTPSQSPKTPQSMLALPQDDQTCSFLPCSLPSAASKSSAAAAVAKRAEALRRSLSEFYNAVHPARIGSVAGIVQVFEAHGATVDELRDLNAVSKVNRCLACVHGSLRVVHKCIVQVIGVLLQRREVR